MGAGVLFRYGARESDRLRTGSEPEGFSTVVWARMGRKLLTYPGIDLLRLAHRFDSGSNLGRFLDLVDPIRSVSELAVRLAGCCRSGSFLASRTRV